MEDTYERMKGLANTKDINNFIISANGIWKELIEEGFEEEEVFKFLLYLLRREG